MAAWSDDELRRLGEAEESQIASRRSDGTVVGEKAAPVTLRLLPRAG